MRLSLKKKLSLAHGISYAQKNHFLQTNISVTPNGFLKKTVLCLLQSGLVLHYCPKKPSLAGAGARRTLFCFTLRY